MPDAFLGIGEEQRGLGFRKESLSNPRIFRGYDSRLIPVHARHRITRRKCNMIPNNGIAQLAPYRNFRFARSYSVNAHDIAGRLRPGFIVFLHRDMRIPNAIVLERNRKRVPAALYGTLKQGERLLVKYKPIHPSICFIPNTRRGGLGIPYAGMRMRRAFDARPAGRRKGYVIDS